MDPGRWQKMEAVFTDALELSPAERPRFLDRACRGDAELRGEVAKLLAADEQAGNFLDVPLVKISDEQRAHLAEEAVRIAKDVYQSQVDSADRTAPEVPLPQLERYRIVDFLGEGAMGRVYHAVDEEEEREVALKLLLWNENERVRRFQREARAQARLEHEHICRVFDVGEADGRPYIAMQLIKGDALSEVGDRLSLTEKVQVAAQAAQAVQYAHDRGVIHRDIKPDNIMIERSGDGTVKAYLLDFGIARLLEGHGTTASGQLVGTPAFIAPEQVDWRSAGSELRTDIYGLGATLYFLLAGCAPFSGTQMEILMKVLDQEPPRLRDHDPGLPADLETIVARCLEKKPARRYESAGDLAGELQRFLSRQPLRAERPDPAPPANESGRTGGSLRRWFSRLFR